MCWGSSRGPCRCCCIFLTFLFINAEVWQLAGHDRAMESSRALMGLFALVTAAFLVSPGCRWSSATLRLFERPERVIELVRGTPAAGLVNSSKSLKLDAPLRRGQWANVGLVVLVALSLRVLFVSMLVGVFFFVFGAIAMDSSTICVMDPERTPQFCWTLSGWERR